MVERKSMREKGFEPIPVFTGQILSLPLPPRTASPRSSSTPPRCTEPRPNCTGYVTACVTRRRLPVQFCWACGRRYRGTAKTCAACPKLRGKRPKRAPLRRVMDRKATAWRDGSRFDRGAA